MACKTSRDLPLGLQLHSSLMPCHSGGHLLSLALGVFPPQAPDHGSSNARRQALPPEFCTHGACPALTTRSMPSSFCFILFSALSTTQNYLFCLGTCLPRTSTSPIRVKAVSFSLLLWLPNTQQCLSVSAQLENHPRINGQTQKVGVGGWDYTIGRS